MIIKQEVSLILQKSPLKHCGPKSCKTRVQNFCPPFAQFPKLFWGWTGICAGLILALGPYVWHPCRRETTGITDGLLLTFFFSRPRCAVCFHDLHAWVGLWLTECVVKNDA